MVRVMGRIIFLSAVAFLAFRYISRSNKKHEEIAARVGTTEVLPPERKESAAIAAPQPKVIEQSSAAEPHPKG
jgi:hypothetical protein